MLGQSTFSYSARDVEEVALWWLGPEKSRSDRPPQIVQQSRAFRNSGLVAMKRGNVSVLFDAGPFGPWSAGHSHADTLSLLVSVGSEDILIDPGTYSYLDPQWRDTFRGTAAHNTIRIDGEDQATPAGPFRWLDKPEVSLIDFSSTTELDYATAVCRYRGFTHKRTIQVRSDSELEITDELEGSLGEHLVEQFWHLGQPVRQTGPEVWRIGELAEFLVPDGQYEQGWRSSAFGSKEISPVIVVRRRVALPTTLRAQLRLVKAS